MSVLEIENEELNEFVKEEGVHKWQMTRRLYYQAGELGWFNGDEKVELLGGTVYYKYLGEEWRWTRREYEQAAELGWFDGQRVELIKGKVYIKMPQNPPHTLALRASSQTTTRVFGPGFDVRQQLPLLLSTDGEPEPDILVVPGSWEDYIQHPTQADVVLLIEISDTTLRYDQNQKAALYAEAGLADYWLLNVNNRTLQVRRDPAPLPNQPSVFAYQTLTVYTETDSVAPLALPQTSINVANLLPPLPEQEDRR